MVTSSTLVGLSNNNADNSDSVRDYLPAGNSCYTEAYREIVVLRALKLGG